MRAAISMAGYTASEADELRKSIAKKKEDVLQKHRLKFIDGAQKAGIPSETARPSSKTGKISPATASPRPTPPIMASSRSRLPISKRTTPPST